MGMSHNTTIAWGILIKESDDIDMDALDDLYSKYKVNWENSGEYETEEILLYKDQLFQGEPEGSLRLPVECTLSDQSIKDIVNAGNELKKGFTEKDIGLFYMGNYS